ncbi:hypothetical protein LR48_Vigan04g190600 [Vigna angularis]|uniref:RRM domain-containing protein n=1 Tax=Phaseolus angularis TaxID=3914 RepID=A0A0L9UG34_PHAAN|nr:hypothetical protein LR48_Vigan04g190600 [Vigna angularis]
MNLPSVLILIVPPLDLKICHLGRLQSDPTTGRARGFGFVVFSDPAVAEIVIKEKHNIDGRMDLRLRKRVSRWEGRTKLVILAVDGRELVQHTSWTSEIISSMADAGDAAKAVSQQCQINARLSSETTAIDAAEGSRAEKPLPVRC